MKLYINNLERSKYLYEKIKIFVIIFYVEMLRK